MKKSKTDGNDSEPQLYNLSDDPGEQLNLHARYPEKSRELAALLEAARKAGRSR